MKAMPVSVTETNHTNKKADEVVGKAIVEFKHNLRSTSGMLQVHIPFEEVEKAFDKVLFVVRYRKVLRNLLSELYCFDQNLFKHSMNVMLYSLTIGKRSGLCRRDLIYLGLAALFHDVGKLFTPKEVLNKPGKLTDEEYEIIKNHSKDGYELLREKDVFPEDVLEGVIGHHERLNGSGYPFGLKGDEVSLFSRIIGISDVYDAMTEERVYRKALSPFQALDFLRSRTGEEFDSDLVRIFNKAVTVYPNGVMLHLSDGADGIVVGTNEIDPLRPKLLIVRDKTRTPLLKPLYVDLMDKRFSNIQIETAS